MILTYSPDGGIQGNFEKDCGQGEVSYGVPNINKQNLENLDFY